MMKFPGGEGGIRTPEGFDTLLAFQASALDHYATSPSGHGDRNMVKIQFILTPFDRLVELLKLAIY